MAPGTDVGLTSVQRRLDGGLRLLIIHDSEVGAARKRSLRFNDIHTDTSLLQWTSAHFTYSAPNHHSGVTKIDSVVGTRSR